MDYISLSKEADEKFELGKYEEAKTILEKGLSLAKKNRNKSFIEFFLGELQNINGNYELTISHHKKAVESAKKKELKAFFYKNLGAVLNNLGKKEEAIEFFEKALEIKPDDYNSLRNKGVSLSNLERIEEAIEFFEKALEINPGDHRSLCYEGVSLSKLGREKKAIEFFEKALEIRPDDYHSLRQKGVSLSKLGREKEAIEFFEKALEIRPDDYHSLRQKGISLSKLGREKEAIEFFEKALEIKPDDWSSLISKAFTLENTGNEKEAIEIFDFISLNENKVKNEEIIKIVNFKKNALKEKEQDKKTDVLNEVINAFQEKKDDFFKNINDIESKFKKFVDSERSIPENFFSFLSVLRKWNSYTPILPSEKGDNKGGGYFLYHLGKGIVIDPGFNFIENFYQEGFKVADIDAVLISHAHNDHTVDLESILTLVYKHNDAIKDTVIEEMKGKTKNEIDQEIKERLKKKGKKIDIFMNVGTFMKYSGWLNLKDSNEINNVTVLMPNATYKLPEEYHDITIYTSKAKHHEVIDDQYALGFILDVAGDKVGFTCDTGWDWDRNEIMVKPFLENESKLVIAHLGSIKSKEFKYVEMEGDEERNNCFYSHHLGLLGLTKFLDTTKPDLTIVSEFGEELRGMRKEIVKRIGKVLELNCLPGDIGLHVRLNDLAVYCFIEENFISYKEIEVIKEPYGSNLYYCRKVPNQEFLEAVERKKISKPIPLAKRIKIREEIVS